MPSTRRTLLRTGLLGVLGGLAGCSGDRSSPGTDDTSSRVPSRTRSTESGAQTTGGQPPDETTTDRPTTVRPRERSVEFVHRTPVLDSGIADADSAFFARRIGTPQELDALDPLAARGDVPGQDLAAVERFADATNLKETTLLVVQARTPSPTYGLAFSFLDPWPPTQVAVRTRRFAERGSDASEPANSTLLLRIPARTSSPSVTVADLAGVRDESQPVITFDLPNDLRSESLTAEPLDGFPTFAGGIASSREAAERLVPAADPYAGFVRGTDFDRSYLLGVRTRISSGGVFAWPRMVARDGERAAIELWQYPFAGGPSAEFQRFVLARISGEAPAHATATVRRPPGSRATLLELSSDPSEWPTTDTGTTNADG